MDKKLYEYLINLDFLDEDIAGFCSMFPGLEFISFERAMKNIRSVITSGYPEADIDSLIFSNPGFLCNNPDDTIAALSKIDGNVEEKLKDDPFLI